MGVGVEDNHHQRGGAIMKQGVLGFQYEEENRTAGMTGLGGLGVYLEMTQVMGLREWVEGHVGVMRGGQGWRDSEVVVALVLLNLVGGESVGDLGILEKDTGLCRMLRQWERHGRRERGGERKRWRRGRVRGVPSESAVFRYLERFHDEGEERRRQAGGSKAFIPGASKGLKGLWEVNREVLGWVQGREGFREATLDMDATLVESEKREALWSYKKTRAYQPLTTYWAEAEMVVHSEFRDGNVPAGYEQLRVLQEALGHLPKGVEKVRLRSDTAGYQQELLKYCAEGKDEGYGVIEFAVGVDVTTEFKRAVSRVKEEDWQELYRWEGEERVASGQQWAEVCFVPNWIGHKKSSPQYRFLAIREPLSNPPLPGLAEQMELPFAAVELLNRGWYKLTAVVTNRELCGEEVIGWYRQRCGKSEQAHGVLKNDLAGGRLPSGRFGANAAWWAITVLAFNLNAAMKRLVWGAEWTRKRLKALRFALIVLPGRVVRRSRRLFIRLAHGHPAYPLLLKARHRILALAHAPPAV